MNIKQNIVRIKTATQIGSGIIYPCETEIKEFDKTKYIIFTNRHIINDLNTVENKDLHKVLDIDIYDNNGNLINIDDGEHVKLELFIPSDDNVDGVNEDIAAILITFDYKLKLNLLNRILFNDKDLDDLCVEGFPQVLYNNNISSKIELKGKYKEIFPKNKKLGVFQITDDYHWYSNYKDLRLFQGFSGGPIYKKTVNTTYIVGLNQSLLNLNEGENPFKLLYYYKFNYVLEYLREKGCIIFKRNSDSSVSIRWKASTYQSINSKKERKHKENKNESSKINILLLGASGAGKSSFVKTFLLHKDCIDSVNDGQTTRTNVVYNLSLFNKSPRAVVHFLDFEQFKELMEDLFYEKYLLKALSTIKGKEIKNIKVSKKFINKNKDLEAENQEKYINYKPKKIKSKTDKKTDELIRGIEKYIDECSNNKLDLDYKKFFSDLFKTSSCKFSLKEFNFLNLEEIDSLFQNINIYISDNDLELFRTNIKACFFKCSLILYQEIMKKIKNHKEKTDKARFRNKPFEHTINDEFLCMEIELDYSFDKIDLLSKCLQKKNNSSLTGIINYVEIFDSISNEYAFILDDLEIDELTIVDSVGIDHDSYYTESENDLSKNLDKLIKNNLISFKSDSAVMYLKKLDAGKPTELKNFIPHIFNKVPQSPIYCVFNGLDIFLGSKVNEFNGFSYMCEKPKSIKYLENAETEILSMFKNETYFSKSLYDTLINNISCFCSKEEIIKDNFNIYHYNRKVVYDLLLSICMKEYSCMNIIPENLIKKIGKKEFGDKISQLFENLFFECINENNLGFIRCLILESSSEDLCEEQTEGEKIAIRRRLLTRLTSDIYYSLFQSFNVFVSENKNLLLVPEGEFYNCVSSLDSCVKNMGEDFITSLIIEILIYVKFPGFTNTKVKKLNKNNLVPYNFFELSDLIFSQKTLYKSKYKQFYNNVVNSVNNFETLNDNMFKIMSKNIFSKCLIDTIEKDNKSKSENLMKINYKFYRQLQEIEQEFENKYKNVKFKDLLKYYATDKQKR